MPRIEALANLQLQPPEGLALRKGERREVGEVTKAMERAEARGLLKISHPVPKPRRKGKRGG
jgi:hypothetical protein